MPRGTMRLEVQIAKPWEFHGARRSFGISTNRLRTGDFRSLRGEDDEREIQRQEEASRPNEKVPATLLQQQISIHQRRRDTSP